MGEAIPSKSVLGRKAEKGKTIVKCVPEKYWDTLGDVIKFLDKASFTAVQAA